MSSIPQAFEAHLMRTGSPSTTATSYRGAVERFISWAQNNDIEYPFITYPQVMDYLKYLKENHIQQATIQAYFAGLRHFYTFLIQQNIAATNPFLQLHINVPQSQKILPTLSPQQLEGLYTNFEVKAGRITTNTYELSKEHLPAAYRKKLSIGLMVYQGLDTNALAQLQTTDISLDQGTIQIRANRKHNERTLALKPAQIMELFHYLEVYRPQLLQQYPQAEELQNTLLVHGYSKYTNVQIKLMKRLKKQEPALHSLYQIKASVIMHWLKQYNLREVQYMAGHRSVSTTERYQRADIESLKLDIDRLHPFA